MPRHTHRDHAVAVAATIADPGVIRFVGLYPSREVPKGTVLGIPRAERMPSYVPGTYEAYEAPDEHDGTAIWARRLGGWPTSEPGPVTRASRVCNREPAVGRIVTVVVAAERPPCGGPRSKAMGWAHG